MWSIFKSAKLPKSASKGTPIYDYSLGRRFDPGAPAEVFQPTLRNPVYLFRGPGRVAGFLQVLQPPQVQFVAQVGTQGLGGVQVGQLYGQPLLDPSQIGEGGGSD